MQLFNRWRHKETRTGPIPGVKTGDFGTGGRRYVNRSTNTREVRNDGVREKDTTCLRIVGYLVLALTLGIWVYSEYRLRSSLALVAFIDENAKAPGLEAASTSSTAATSSTLFSIFSSFFAFSGSSLPSFESKTGSSSPTESRSSDSLSESDLVIAPLENVHISPDKTIVDDYFGITFTNALSVNRVTEYCQWREIAHHNRVKVGTRFSYCKTASSSQQCQGAQCAGLSEHSCSSACCSKVYEDLYEDHLTYTYHKEWSSHKINSMFFDNAITYNNPTRDPAPAMVFSYEKQSTPVRAMLAASFGETDNGGDVQGKKGEEISISVKDLREAHQGENWSESVFLSSEIVRKLKKANTFTRADGRYLYSPYEQSSMEKIGQAGAAYLLENVVDLSSVWKGKCTAGDVRVSWRAEKIPEQITVAGQILKNSRKLVKYQDKENILIARRGIITKEGFLKLLTDEAKNSAFWIRLGIALVCLLLGAFIYCMQ